jgi:hypothetical protein
MFNEDILDLVATIIFDNVSNPEHVGLGSILSSGMLG